MNLFRQLALATVLATIIWGALPGRATAGTLLTPSSDPASRALGASQRDSVWLEGNYLGTIYHASGSLIRGKDADWVLTAAHLTSFSNGTALPASIFTIGSGSNYVSDRGATSLVEEVILPFGVNSGIDKSKPDVALLRLSTRLTAPGLRFQVGASPALTDFLLLTGFGSSASADGYVRSFTSAAFNSQPTTYNDAYYFSGEAFSGINAQQLAASGLLNLEGYGTPGDSGGIVKDRFGCPVGVIVSGNGSGTFMVDLTNAEILASICSVTQPVPMAVPVLTLSLTGTAVHLAWDATAAGFQLQSSGDLADWSDLGSVITAHGTLDDPIASRPRQFYRLTGPREVAP